MFQAYFKQGSKCVKSISLVFKETPKWCLRVFLGGCKELSRVFYGNLRGVLRVF